MSIKSNVKIDTRIRSLRSYLDEFEKGTLQVPSFQREFLWDIPAIIQLFDSIKRKYPIGSIQFWQPIDDGEVWLDSTKKIGPYTMLKSVSDPKPIFILDGLQRLSSIIGCLINPDRYNHENFKFDQALFYDKFNIYYDLETEGFISLRRNKVPELFQVPLYVLVNTSDFRKFSREKLEKLDDNDKIELYLDRADEISKIITEYEIASVDILNATVEEAIDIFWRVNKEGLEISKDWIVNALVSNSDFQLQKEMDSLIDSLKIYNFSDIKRDLLFNCIQSSFDKLSFDIDIVTLVKKDKHEFISKTKKTLDSIKKGVDFLFNRFNIVNTKLLPSNWQLIFIVEFFNVVEEPTKEQFEELENWFWFTIYSNYFTVFNPSKRNKAFIQFRNYFFGTEKELVFNDEPSLKFIAPKYNFTNFGSVRFTTNVLFQLKKFKVETENCIGFESIKLFANEPNSLENTVYFPVFLNNKTYEFLNQKHKDFSFLLDCEHKEFFNSFFISDDMIHQNNQGYIKNVLSLRKALLIREEMTFVESLGIAYS